MITKTGNHSTSQSCPDLEYTKSSIWLLVQIYQFLYQIFIHTYKFNFLKLFFNKFQLNVKLYKEDNTWCKTDVEKAELFRANLLKVFQSHHDIVNKIFEEYIENSPISSLPLYLAPELFTPGELQYHLKLFLLRKYFGLDLITVEVARQLPKRQSYTLLIY